MGVDLRAVDVVNRLIKNDQIKNKTILTLGRQNINVPILLNGNSFSWLDELLLHLGARRVDSMDVSSYENASIIFDLQNTTPAKYVSNWDIVLDFGTTEHIFDQKAVFSNIYSFLKPNGLYVAILPRTNWNDHGLYQYCPEFYWTLSEVFPFIFECYTVSVSKEIAEFYLYDNYGQDPKEIHEIIIHDRTYNIFFARKIGNESADRKLSLSPRYKDNFHKNGPNSGIMHSSVQILSTIEFINRPMPSASPRIALIHISTGPYKIFTERFVSSAMDGFESNSEKIFYLITDDPSQFFYLKDRFNCNIRFLKIEHEPWPNPTLKRFEYISKLESIFSDDNITHAFFVNANAVFISANPVMELITAGKQLGFVRHPGFINNPSAAPFEDQEDSLAFIPNLIPASEIYVQGFFYGGEIKAFMELILMLKERVNDDLINRIIALWHDESHLNWARISHWKENSIIFDSGYAYPEGWSLDSPCRILSRDKSKLMDLSFKKIK